MKYINIATTIAPLGEASTLGVRLRGPLLEAINSLIVGFRMAERANCKTE